MTKKYIINKIWIYPKTWPSCFIPDAKHCPIIFTKRSQKEEDTSGMLLEIYPRVQTMRADG